MCTEVAAQDLLKKEGTIWCGGFEEGQDVAVYLVPNGTNLTGRNVESEHYEKTLVVLKVHSSRLSRCSKYFETCLSERWRKPSTESSLIEFVLEVHSDVKSYISCFSRMYSPFLKDFHDVKHSLELLKVASQIEFHELMDSISRYISGIPWSIEDEVRIREYSTSPDFPCGHAKDLIARLGLHMTEEDRHKHMCDVVQQCTRTALHHDGNFKNTRAFLEEFLQSVGSGTSGNVARTVVSIVSGEAKNMFNTIGKECEEKGFYHLVPQFTEKLLSICWVLKALLIARVAEELVQYMVQLDTFATIVANVNCFNGPEPCKKAAFELAKLILQTYSEVLDGHLLLNTSERTALLRNWHVLLESHVSKDSYYQITKSFFLTLPLEQQTELIKLRKDRFTGYIDTSSLVALLKRSWPAMESE
ncbi:hypothetical protein M758_8G107100, partial [Ceratodon purpureus]